MKVVEKILQRVAPIFPYFLVFVASLFVPSDPDLGWHLKYGEYFFQHHAILRENLYSTMMAHYHWANTDWATDILTYFIFHHFGFLGLTLLGAIVITATFFFFAKAARLTLWDEILLFPFLLYLEQPLNVISFRGQLLSLLFTGVLFFLISRYRRYSKILWWLVPLFFVWVNLNGEFLLGLGLLGLWIVVYLGQRYWTMGLSKFSAWFRNDIREIVYLVFIFVFCFSVTAINPFGFELHQTALSHFGSPLLFKIAEYLPFDILSQLWWNQVFVCVALLFSLLFFFFKREFRSKIPTFIIALIILGLSLEVRRYAWPAYYLCLPLFAPLANALSPKKKYVVMASSFVFLFAFWIVLLLKTPFQTYGSYNWNEYCKQEFIMCSPKSANYLLQHPQQGPMLSLYGWGGWLIWNYPAIKPSIDGRMHMWRDSTGYSAFEEYYAYEQNQKEIDSSQYNVVYMSTDKPLYHHMEQLLMAGRWRAVYKDDYAAIFVRNSGVFKP
jgi:hypothetical protein